MTCAVHEYYYKDDNIDPVSNEHLHELINDDCRDQLMNILAPDDLSMTMNRRSLLSTPPYSTLIFVERRPA